ncbi:MAG: hypothetical protein KR126chlam6_00918 [Candidatus Anoxychlamydiales bacterium]|nr:hypothetical protein [Candidatus Anoxychlamydiales bacterium]
MKFFLRLLPIIIIVVLMIVAISIGGIDFFSFDNLKKYNETLINYSDNNKILFPIIFILIYIASTALSIPGAVFLTILAGFLFGKYLATVYVAIGATIGATILFLAAKYAVKDFFLKKAGPLLKKMSQGFQKNARCYMLFLRLIPLFPFWLVNIVPAFFNVRFRTYLWTTFFGIMPGTFVFAQAGVGLKSILQLEEFKISSIFTFQINLTLILLAIFMLLPIIFKKIKDKIC